MEKIYKTSVIDITKMNLSEKVSNQLKSILLVLAVFVAGIGNVWGQKRNVSNEKISSTQSVESNSNEKELWKKEPYGNYDMSSELLDKRDAFSKHFPNSAGSTTAHIASGPIHYQEDSQWKTIYHSIEPSSTGGFQNIHNSFKTYYPASSNGNIVTELPNGLVMRDMQSMRMYYEGNGQVLSEMNISSAAGKSDFNILTYSGVYGSDIDLRLTQHTSMRKMDYILNNANALSSAPQEAEYLVFEEKITLPEGIIAVLENNIIILKTANGEVLGQYERPEIREKATAKNDERKSEITEGLYSISQSGKELFIQTKVSILWLKNANRHFPINIDPTISLYPNVTANWTGAIETARSPTGISYTEYTGNMWSASYFSTGTLMGGTNGASSSKMYIGVYNNAGYAGTAQDRQAFHSWAKFNTSSILDGSTISSINLFSYVEYDPSDNIGVDFTKITTEPVGNSMANRLNEIRGGSIYNADIQTLDNGGAAWSSYTLGGTANSDLQAKLANDWFAVGYKSGRVNFTNDFARISGQAETNKPYITVNYICPTIVDRTITVNGVAGPVSVNVGQTVTIASSGGNTANYCYWISSNGGTTWDMLAAGNCNQASFTYTICTPGTYVFHVRNSDACGYCWDGGRTCGSYNAVTVNVNAEPGFGSNAWNVLCYGAGDASGGSNAWASSQYKGFYTMSDLNFDTRTGQPYSNAQSWGDGGSPSSALGYQGCSIGVDNHSYIFKRQGFTCGTYQLNLPSHDDMAILLVDGIEVWRNYGCCAVRTAVWSGYLGSTSTVELRVSEGGGGSHGALEFVSLSISATVTGTNPTTCGGNGSITMSNVQNGHRSVYQSDFSAAPAGSSLTGNASIAGGELTLTAAANSQLGSAVFTPSYRANAWTANYSQYIGGGNGADGMSFTYGPISGAANGALGAGGENGWASGLVVSFDTYNGATNSQLNIYWNGSLLTSSAVNPVSAPAFRTASFVPVRILVNTSNQLTVDWNSINLLSNYSLPAGYVSADKSAWNYGFSARTGGLNDAHKVSDLYISSIAFLEYSINGTSWSTTNPILAPAGSYTVQARPVGINCTNSNIGSVTLTNPNTIDWANLQSPSSTSICTNGSATLYGRVYKNGYTNIAGADANMTVQVGYNSSNTNPNTWASGAWSAATFNVQTGTSGNDDEYQATLSNLTTGTYYYTFRFRYCSDGAWYYGGYSAGGGGFWNGTSNVNGTLTVNQPSVAPTSITGTTTICNGSNTTLTAIGGTLGTGANYEWGTGTTVGTNPIAGQTGASITVSPTSTSSYWVRIINSAAPCASSTTGVSTAVTVNQPSVAPSSITGTTTICNGTSTTLTAAGGTLGTNAVYEWGTGTTVGSNVISGSTASITVSPISTTTYWVRIINGAAPCSATPSGVSTMVTVNQPSVNPTSITGNTVCLGASTTLTAIGGSLGVGGGANYQWGTGSVVGTNPISGAISSTLSVSPTSSASYWVQIVNGTGPCSATTAGLTTLVTVTTPTIATTPTTGSAVWRGATSTDWATTSNWYSYNGSNYTVATVAPSPSSNVIIPATTAGCVSSQPTVISGEVDANNVTVETGAALTMTTGTLNVAGNFTINGTGTFTPGTGTVNFIGDGTQVVTTGTQAFNDVTLNGSGTVQLAGNTTINGKLTINNGQLLGGNNQITVKGDWASPSTGFVAGTSTVVLAGASGTTQTINNGTAGEFFNLTHNTLSKVQLAEEISLLNDFSNSVGEFSLLNTNTSSYNVTIAGNWTNSGMFTPGTATVFFSKDVANENQNVNNGDSYFYDIFKSGQSPLNSVVESKMEGDLYLQQPVQINGTISLTGTNTQSISGGSSVSVVNIQNLKINKSGDVTLSKPVKVVGTLTMSQGNIITSSANKLEIGSSTSSLGSVVWTDGNVVGPMKRWFAGAVNSSPESGIFPVGLSNVNRYAQINFTAAPGSGGYIDMEYKSGPPANAANWTYLTTPDGQLIQTFENEGYWDITPYNASGTVAYPDGLNTQAFTLKLRANGLTSVNDMSVTRIIRSPGPLHTTWEPAGFHIAPTGSLSDFVIQSNTVTGFSWFNIGAPNSSPLPVELLNFNGTCNEGMVNLVWQSASEFNSSHFDVEKSTDGETWRVLATIPSAGISNELLTYQTVDNNGTQGNNYYRLRQVDIDGKEKLYDPINVSCAETTAGYFTSYPNPSGNEFQVIVNNKEILGACTLNIVDAQGKVIDQRSIEVKDGINMFVINEKLTPGIYFLNITNGTKTTQVIKHAVK